MPLIVVKTTPRAPSWLYCCHISNWASLSKQDVHPLWAHGHLLSNDNVLIVLDPYEIFDHGAPVECVYSFLLRKCPRFNLPGGLKTIRTRRMLTSISEHES